MFLELGVLQRIESSNQIFAAQNCIIQIIILLVPYKRNPRFLDKIHHLAVEKELEFKLADIFHMLYTYYDSLLPKSQFHHNLL